MTFSWKADKSESAQNKWVRKSMWEGIWAVAPVLSVAVSHHHQHPTHSQTNRSRPPLPTKLTRPKIFLNAQMSLLEMHIAIYMTPKMSMAYNVHVLPVRGHLHMLM